MKRVIIFFFLALFVALVVQPNLASSLVKRNEDVPVNTTSSPLTNEDVSVQQCKSKAVICIDADNGGSDYGYEGEDKMLQKDINLALALKIGDRLSRSGYHVIYTRQDDKVPDFYDAYESADWRIDKAESGKADYFLSITLYSDKDIYAQGYSIFTQENDQMISLGNEIVNQFELINYSEYKGIDSDHYENFPILSDKDIPSMLLQIGHITNENDYSHLVDENFQTKLANAILNAFIKEIN